MYSDSQPLVSVLTPVYNGEKYLADCIESVLAQTYKNWEYLIVNNCSTDQSLEIAKSYAKTDPRVRIHNNHSFVNARQNHNIGFRLISSEGKYCKVVQADDWLFPECISRMVNIAEANPSVGIVGAYILKGEKVECDRLPLSSKIVSSREICRADLFSGPGTSVFGSPTSLLIRSDLIRPHKDFYAEANIYADREATYEVLKYSDFGFVHQVLSYERTHDYQESSFVRKVGGYLPGKLNILKKYGPVYLTKEEYEERLNQKMKEYYRFLGHGALVLREKEFWDYHINELKKAGFSLNWIKLATVACLELVKLFSNPQKVVRVIDNRIIKYFVRKS